VTTRNAGGFFIAQGTVPMATVPTDWKEVDKDGFLKRKMYYRSREFTERKAPVIERSKGICERCHKRPGELVHHLHYRSLYNEQPEDMQHWCKGCHDFVEGRSNVDPKALDDMRINLLCGPRLNSRLGEVSLNISRKAFDQNHLVGELSPTERVVSLSIEQESSAREHEESFFSKFTADLCEREVVELIEWLQMALKRMSAANMREPGQ
jgi:hypothetical protein